MHLKVTDGPDMLHISHLYHYVSAYHLTKEMVTQLEDLLLHAVKKARELSDTQIVDMDGEMCFHVHPSGNIVLMLPWKSYQIAEDK